MMAILPDASYIDLLPFYAFIRNLFGYGNIWTGVLVIMWWILLLFASMSISYLTEVFYLVTSGKTTFEVERNIFVVDKRTINEKIRATFGKYWALNFIFPMHCIFKEEEDPVCWPTISGIKTDVLLDISTLQ